MQVFDVIIVGAGPAGSALAAGLARDGYSVLVLEKHRFPRDKVCGDLVSAKGLTLLAGLGCYEEIARRAYIPIKESVVVLDDRTLARGALPKIPGLPSFGHAVPRVELDAMIFEQAAKAGAQSVQGCTVQGFELGPSLVVVHAAVDGRDRQFLGRFIVGADGAASVVARCAGLEMRDARYVQLALRAYCTGFPLEHAVLYFAEEFFPGYAWVFPVNENVANIGVGMVKESALKHGLRLREFYARLVRYLERQAAERGLRVELSRPAGWPIKTYGGARRNYFERGLLIGDAGCFVDPISGEGIPLALETAAMAAEVIRAAFAECDFSAESLARYERRWRDRYDRDLSISDLIVSIARNRYLAKVWVQWLRTIAMTAARDPDYAAKTGGVLAGLVPNREALAGDVILKSVMHGPAFWVEAFGLARERLPDALVHRSIRLVQWEAGAASSMLADFDWFRDWAIEIGDKHLKVLDALTCSARTPR